MMAIAAVFRKRRPPRYRPGRHCKRPARRPVLPTVSRKTWAWTIVAAMTGGALFLFGQLAYRGLCRSDFFRLTAITISGCRHLDKERVLEQSGLDIHTNLLAVRTADTIGRLTAHPWIDRATVTRKWPNEIAIRISERQPVALINLKEGLCYLDKKFAVIGPVTPTDDIDYPVITGLEDLSAPLTGETGRPPPLADALELISQAGRGNSYLPGQNISEIHVNEQGELVLYLLDQAFPVYLGRGDMKDKYGRLANILKGLYKRREIFRIDHIRMDYLQDKVLVSMSESGANTRS